MKRLKVVVTAICLVALPAISLAEVSLGASIDYTSRYIWRGFDFYDDGPGIQPGASLGFSPADGIDVSLGVWANYDVDNTEEWDEFDYTLDLSYALSETLSISGGYIYYDFPEADTQTQEVYLGATFALPADVEGFATIYYDFDEGEGYYLTAGASYSMELGANLEGSLGGSAGYMNYSDSGSYAGLDAFSDVTVSAGLSYAIVEGVSANCSLNYAYVPDSDVNEDNEFWYMVGLSAEM
ncbi:MAG: hypothetical protein C0609_01035 [Deltaproteobacteria bacterium]|nr:MAG: hypothetical protein C0609_01035 [Deltaproteobacteria bacterium]